MNGTSTVRPGSFAGRYVIQRELGRGGMAFVYLARDEQRDHPVAIKVMRPELASVIGTERFLREIRLSQTLHHPQIVPVLDSGEYEGQLYLALTYMEGGSLRGRLEKDKQLPLDDAVAITRSIANALEHAHDKGIIHRDVKPENILFTSGQACLADFGIARALERATDDNTTSTSVVRGTPSYMSPEQASGEESLDGRSDIYSLGCVVYEMLAGMQPFVGPTQQSVIAQRFTHAPRPVRMYRPALPAAIEMVLEKAMAVSKADRYQRATDFATALEAASRTNDSIGRPIERVSFIRENPVGAAIVGALAVAAIAASIWILRVAPPPKPSGIPEGDPRRIAVLYLDDLTPATLPPHVADGITEDLIDQLGSVRALHVISPTGVRQFRNGSASVDSIRRALNVGTIVSGSVARSGNKIRVNARLSDALTGQQLHSLSVEEPATELFSLQARLVDQVGFALRQRLGEEIAVREQRARTKSLEAWETAQLANAERRRALELTSSRDQETGLIRADSLFAKAARIDESWLFPLLRRGRIAMNMAFGRTWPPHVADSLSYRQLPPLKRQELWLARTIEFANEALKRDPRSADALALRGEARMRLFTFRVPGSDSLVGPAEQDFRAALEIRPDLATAWVNLATIFQSQNRFADAALAAKRAYDADAFFEEQRVISTGFFASLYGEQFDDARRWCGTGLKHYPLDPNFAECELTLLGWAGRSRQEVAAAHRSLHEIETASAANASYILGWGYRRLMVAAVLARAGMQDSARALVSAVHAAPDSLTRNIGLGESYVWLLLNDRDKSVATLSAYVRDAPPMRANIAAHPWFRELKDDPRFVKLVQPAR